MVVVVVVVVPSIVVPSILTYTDARKVYVYINILSSRTAGTSVYLSSFPRSWSVNGMRFPIFRCSSNPKP